MSEEIKQEEVKEEVVAEVVEGTKKRSCQRKING